MSDRKVLIHKAYVSAQKKLRNAHQDEFHKLLEAEYADLGIEVRKRLTGERKRQRDIEKLREQLSNLESQPIDE